MSTGTLTRRRFVGVGIGTAAAAGLAACGSGGTAASPAGSPATTRVVDTVYGAVTVPQDPTRIVASDFPEACALLDLGITPIGRPGYMPELPAYDTALTGVPAIDDVSTGELDLEKIASLAPDLIVGDDWADPKLRRAPYRELAAIAPTALFEWQQAAGNWPDLAAQTAAALGRSTQMAALERRYDDASASIRRQNRALLARTRWDLIDCAKDSWDLYGAASSHGRVLASAGVRLGAAAGQKDGFKQYSLEQLTVLSGTDVIVTSTVSLPFLTKQRLFAELPAVKAGRVYTTDLFFPASYGIAQALLAEFDSFCAKAGGAR